MEEFVSLSRNPLVSFQKTNVQPSGALYVTPDDQLLVQVANSRSGVTVNVGIRWLDPYTGKIQTTVQPLTPTTDRSLNNLNIALYEGFIIGINVSTSNSCARGQCFVRMFLMRGANNTVGAVAHALGSGYISAFDVLGWPTLYSTESLSGLGVARSITGSVPAAGAEISEAVPTNARWRLVALRYSLTTAVAVANRTSRLQIDDGANIIFTVDPSFLQTASLTDAYDWGPNMPQLATNSTIHQSFPPNVILGPGFRIRTNTLNIQAADQYTAPQYLVEELISQ